MRLKTLSMLALTLLLTACGGGKDKGEGGIADLILGEHEGPGSCYVDTPADDTAICYTFSGLAWTVGTAEDYCEAQDSAVATAVWEEDTDCPSGFAGTCEISLVPGFETEMYFYGMGAEAEKEACDLIGGDWSE